ncbi:MAG: hypothetical protein U9O98_10315 [Asgard group archaeon]|nr:hypothetical protein [Asgard group archaeon]
MDGSIMGERKSSEEIIALLAQILTSEEESLSQLSRRSKELDDYLSHETIERHLKLIVLVQDLFSGQRVHYAEQEIGDRTYKTAWVEEQS